MTFSVIVATYNRAGELAVTLDGLSRLRPAGDWEVIVVDNNSTDRTREVVDRAASRFPVPLRYLLEPRQGKALALNTGIQHARGDILMFTDDDAIVEPDWLERAAAALGETGAAYVGGRVLPRWERPRPAWIPEDRSRLWAVIALLDFGPDRAQFGRGRIGWPLGVNMAVRADVFHRHELWWDNRYDRTGKTLRGAGQREWCLRARAAGLTGIYAPDMVVHHLVPADRLTKAYFRRWYYWYGISRAVLYQHRGFDMEGLDEQHTAASAGPHVAGVPRHMIKSAGRHLLALVTDTASRRPVPAMQHELWLCFFAGIVRQRWRDRAAPIGAAPVATGLTEP
jgi:glucosyl-dolichyl phosphate glucuronosyltransferase